MDYSYFSAPAQPAYPFLALPPTPAHSYETNGDRLQDGPDRYQDTHVYNAYEQPFRFDPNTFVPQQPPQQQHSPPASTGRPSLARLPTADSSSNIKSNGIASSADYDVHELNGNQSSSEEKESLTPAQSRRKAQNRAAQRAFRERKERHVKDLESKLNNLEAHSSTLLTDNERLKRELAKLATQNEILRATTISHPPPSSRSNFARSASPVPGPQTFSPTDFQVAVGLDPVVHPVKNQTYRSTESGERMLSAGATWELIQGSEAYRKGMVDVSDVIARLKGMATCDGTGPAFREKEIRRAIEESVKLGGDELI